MKKLALIGLVSAFSPLLSQGAKHLVLHFDVNGTIMAADTEGRRLPEEAILEKLAGRTYCWDGQGVVSYAEYCSYAAPDKEARRALLNRFLLAVKEVNHPDADAITAEYNQLVAQIGRAPVFPSFYRLINYLDERQIPYTVHLRTFGSDGTTIVQDAEEKLGRPLFTKRLWNREGVFYDEESAISLEGAYQTFCGENVLAQEDWFYWGTHDKAAEAGKRFPLDPNAVGTLSIFFDDHILPAYSPRNIVFPVDLEGNPLDIAPLLQSGQLCPVDTLEAIRDPDYFIKKVEAAMATYRCPG